MLLPVDLMSVVSAGSSSTQPRNAGGSSEAATSWLFAADASAADGDGNNMINKIFMTYANDGEANPEARFAADLKALLSAHGVRLDSAHQTVEPGSVSLGRELAELEWSVDELLHMSMGSLAGGNSLPPGDQSLPFALSSWLEALVGSASGTEADIDAAATSAGTVGALLIGASGTGSDGPATQLSGGLSLLAGAGSLTQSAAGMLTDTGELATRASGTPAMLDAAARLQGDVPAATVSSATTAADGGAAHANNPGNSGSALSPEQELMLRAAVAAESNRQASETAQVNPGSNKVAADAVNASAFRSIQFSQGGNTELGRETDATQAIQSELTRNNTPLERNQAIASQLTTALVAGGSNDNPAAINSTANQAAGLIHADSSAVMNRAEQRMFATESAQQAQSQAAQQTATRTADGLPRFAMDTAFGQQGWSDSLGKQLLVMSSRGVSSAQIRLDPPELGSLTVKIQMSADQQTSVSFVSQHAVVREALEQQLNRLQDLFRDQGLDLLDVSVSDQSSQQRDEESGGQHRSAGDSGSGDQESVTSEPVIMRSESLIDFYA